MSKIWFFLKEILSWLEQEFIMVFKKKGNLCFSISKQDPFADVT